MVTHPRGASHICARCLTAAPSFVARLGCLCVNSAVPRTAEQGGDESLGK
jgi:hypothetical protein